jgi:hypothetical protein
MVKEHVSCFCCFGLLIPPAFLKKSIFEAVPNGPFFAGAPVSN